MKKRNNLSQLFGNAFLHFFKIIAMYDDVSTIKDFIFDKNQGNWETMVRSSLNKI